MCTYVQLCAVMCTYVQLCAVMCSTPLNGPAPPTGPLEVAYIELARNHVQSILRASPEHAQTMFRPEPMRATETFLAADNNIQHQAA